MESNLLDKPCGVTIYTLRDFCVLSVLFKRNISLRKANDGQTQLVPLIVFRQRADTFCGQVSGSGKWPSGFIEQIFRTFPGREGQLAAPRAVLPADPHRKWGLRKPGRWGGGASWSFDTSLLLVLSKKNKIIARARERGVALAPCQIASLWMPHASPFSLCSMESQPF